MNLYKSYIFKDNRWQKLNTLREKLNFFYLRNDQLEYVSATTLASAGHRIKLSSSCIIKRRRRKRHRRPRNDEWHYRNCCFCAQTQWPSNLLQQLIFNLNSGSGPQPQANAPKTDKNQEVPPNTPSKEPLPAKKSTSEDHDSDSSMTSSAAVCKELLIDSGDVACVQKYLTKNPSVLPDINRKEFVNDEAYRGNALFKFHPTVKIGKKDLIPIEKLHDSPKVNFAAGLGLACKKQMPKSARKISSSQSEDSTSESSSDTKPPAIRLSTRNALRNAASESSSATEDDLPRRIKPKSTRTVKKTSPIVYVSSDSSSSTSKSDDEDSVQAMRALRSGRATKRDDARSETGPRGEDKSNSDEGSVQAKRAQRAVRATKRDDSRSRTGPRGGEKSDSDEGSVQAKRAQRAGRATKRDDARSGTGPRGEDESDSDEGSVKAKRAQRAGQAPKRDDARSGTGPRGEDESDSDEGSVQAKRAQRAGRATKRDDARSGNGPRGEDKSDSDEGSVQAKRAQRAGRATKRDDARSGNGPRGEDKSSSSDGSGKEFQTRTRSKKENIKPRAEEQGKPKSSEPKSSINRPVTKTTTKEKFQKKLQNSVNGRDYSSLEDHAIVAWVSVGGRERRVNGNRIWRELATEYKSIIGLARSWHSLRNRYLRYILPSLGLLCLDPALQAKLRSGAAKGEIKLKRKNSLNRRNSLLHPTPVQSASSKMPRVLRSESVTPRAIEKELMTRQTPTPAPVVTPKRVSFGTPTYSEVTKKFADKRQRRSSGEVNPKKHGIENILQEWQSSEEEVMRETPTEAVSDTKRTRTRKLFTNKAN